jgi:hypothetical protein
MSDKPAPDSGSAGDRPIGFDCCGAGMDDWMAGCPCGSIMKRHPFVTSAMLAVMALAALAIPAGIILGVIAFFRTF